MDLSKYDFTTAEGIHAALEDAISGMLDGRYSEKEAETINKAANAAVRKLKIQADAARAKP
jgi:hypothetical protein